MRQYFFIMGLSILLLTGSQAAQAQTASNEVKATEEVSTPQDVGNKICPVTGEKIDETTKAIYEYEGKIYNFCCPVCIDAFKKDPQTYIKKIEEELQARDKGETKEGTEGTSAAPDSQEKMNMPDMPEEQQQK
jgi:YHS domain-containing protein